MHADGSGLYLAMKTSGAKSWMFGYQIAGRRREMGLGKLTALSAVQARAEAARLKAIVQQGVDPLEAKSEAKRAQEEQAQADRATQKRLDATFRRVAEEHIARLEAGWKNSKHRRQRENTLKTYVYPVIGEVPVSEVTVEHVLDILQPIWSTKPETASRVRMRIEAVLDAVKVKGLRVVRSARAVSRSLAKTGASPLAFRSGLTPDAEHSCSTRWRDGVNLRCPAREDALRASWALPSRLVTVPAITYSPSARSAWRLSA